MSRILAYRLGSLGDTIVALPSLHKVRSCFPDDERILLTNLPVSLSAPRMEDILEGSGLIHRCVAYEMGVRSPTALLDLWWRLRTLRADALVYLAGPRGLSALRRDLRFFRTCGIRRIIGAPLTPDLLHNRVDSMGEEEYECARLARCLEAELGVVDLDDPRNWDLAATPRELAAADWALAPLQAAPFVAINMGGKALVNDWGHDNWAALLTQLTFRFAELRWVFFGAGSDIARAEDLVRSRPTQMLNLCGRLSIRETTATLSRARLFVGHDSGPMHLAGSTGVTCVGIFSDQNKRHKWFPYGKQHRIIYPSGPISTITVRQVFEATVGVLGEREVPHLGSGRT